MAMCTSCRQSINARIPTLSASPSGLSMRTRKNWKICHDLWRGSAPAGSCSRILVSGESAVVGFRNPLHQSFPGEMTNEFAAFANLTANFEIAVVIDQYMLDDSQPQASPASIFVSARVCPVKALGQSGNMNRVNADTCVLYSQVRAVPVGTPGDFNAAVGRGVFHGIENQV